MVPSGVLGLTLTTASSVTLPPGARLPSLQLSGRRASPGTPPLQEPWLDVKADLGGKPILDHDVGRRGRSGVRDRYAYARLVPASTGSGMSVLATPRSAAPTKRTASSAVLFPEFPSGVSLVTVAVSLTSTCSLAVSDTRMLVWPPAGWEPRSQVITLPATAQAPAIGELKVAEVIVNGPLPRWVSRTTTFRAWDGPRLSTRISQVAVVPARSGSSGSQALVSLRSARSFTIVDTESVLLDRSGSGSSAERLAVLFKTPAPLA